MQCDRVKRETNVNWKIKWLTWFYTIGSQKNITGVSSDFSQKGQLCEDCSVDIYFHSFLYSDTFLVILYIKGP